MEVCDKLSEDNQATLAVAPEGIKWEEGGGGNHAQLTSCPHDLVSLRDT